MQDIASYERAQTNIQAEYEFTLKDISKTGSRLFELT
jgi:hypothetical protein